MNVAQHIGLWASGRTLDDINREIQEELNFHIECDIEELVRRGTNRELARQEAESKFGDRQKILTQCCNIHTSRTALLARCSLVAVALALAIVGSLVYWLIQARAQNALLTARLNTSIANNLSKIPELAVLAVAPLSPGDNTLSGKIIDGKGKPIPDAKVLLIHKSWPNGRYHQDDHTAQTSLDGSYNFENLYSTEMQNGFLVTVLANGFEMKSEYLVIKANSKAKAFDFKLQNAKPIMFSFKDENGKLLSETEIVLLSRKSKLKEYMIYEQSAEAAKVSTDSAGQVKIWHLLEGDVANFGVFVSGELKYAEVKIGSSSEQTVQLQKNKSPK